MRIEPYKYRVWSDTKNGKVFKGIIEYIDNVSGHGYICQHPVFNTYLSDKGHWTSNPFYFKSTQSIVDFL